VNTEVVGVGGVRIGLRVEGVANARPIVFVHGWAQSARAWAPQLADPALTERFRLVAMDLRGHGASDVPAGRDDDPVTWAGDLAAVLDFAGGEAIIVGWSDGGLVIADYLRAYGTARQSGIVLAGAITVIGRGRRGGRIGPRCVSPWPAALSDDPQVAMPALEALSNGMAAKRVPGAYAQALLGPASAYRHRSAGPCSDVTLTTRMSSRPSTFRRWCCTGTSDPVVDRSAGEYAAGKIPGARTRWFERVGHLPFAEAAPEFNVALRAFAEATQ
jgi:pimeloyl-ACP methyl ester carboxylesterase